MHNCLGLKMENLLFQKQRKFVPSFYAFSCLYKSVKAGIPTTPTHIRGLNQFTVHAMVLYTTADENLKKERTTFAFSSQVSLLYGHTRHRRNGEIGQVCLHSLISIIMLKNRICLLDVLLISTNNAAAVCTLHVYSLQILFNFSYYRL